MKKKWKAIPYRSGKLVTWTERLGNPWPQVPPLLVEAGVAVTVECNEQPCGFVVVENGMRYPLPFIEIP